VANKFTTVKRYSGEGAESAMAFYDELFSLAANSSVTVLLSHVSKPDLTQCMLCSRCVSTHGGMARVSWLGWLGRIDT